jgi:hypothetical protein
VLGAPGTATAAGTPGQTPAGSDARIEHARSLTTTPDQAATISELPHIVGGASPHDKTDELESKEPSSSGCRLDRALLRLEDLDKDPFSPREKWRRSALILSFLVAYHTGTL